MHNIILFSCRIGLYPGHAPANFAYVADTKRKTSFHSFFASTDGLRLPLLQPYTAEKYTTVLLAFFLHKKVMKESLSAFSSEEKASHGAGAGMAGNGAANHEGLNLRLRIAFQNLLL